MISPETPLTGATPGRLDLKVPPLTRTMLAALSAVYLLVALGWSVVGRTDPANSRIAAVIGVIAVGSSLVIAIIQAQLSETTREGQAWIAISLGVAAFAAVEIASLSVILSEGVDIWRPGLLMWMQTLGTMSVLAGIARQVIATFDLSEPVGRLVGWFATAIAVGTVILLLGHLASTANPDRWLLLPAAIAVGALLVIAGVSAAQARGTEANQSLSWTGMALVGLTLAGSVSAAQIGIVERSPGWLALARWILPIATLGFATARDVRADDNSRDLPALPARYGVSIGWIAGIGCGLLAAVAWIQSAGIAVDLSIITGVVFGLMLTRQAISLRTHENEVGRLRQSTEELQRIANIDMLTSLPNRAALERRFAEEFERASRYEQPLTVLFADIDHFKTINDTYGHAAGDRLLLEVAQRLRTTARSIDFVARYGGEEFVVIAPGTWSADALILAERLRSAIERIDYLAAGRISPTTISIGIAGFPEHAIERATLLERADAALYQAKARGRNRTVLFGQSESAEDPG